MNARRELLPYALLCLLVGAEIQLQDVEQEWAEHERMRLAEQEAQGG